jgi:hypothetical protein
MKRLANQELSAKKSKVSDFEATLETEEINYESSWHRTPLEINSDLGKS